MFVFMNVGFLLSVSKSISLIKVTFSKLKLEFISFDLQIARGKMEVQMIYTVVWMNQVK